MAILALGIVIVMVICGLMKGNRPVRTNRSYSGKVSSSQGYPTTAKVTRSCPYCGFVATAYYSKGVERVPALFRCSDCLRYYGNVASMTPEEKQLVQKSDEDCCRVKELPELGRIVSEVVNYFKNYRSGGADSGMVAFEKGKVEICGYYKDGDKTAIRRPLTEYTPISEIADQQMCLMCYWTLKKEMPQVAFTFGNGFVSIEKSA
jgi:hypothetical protein